MFIGNILATVHQKANGNYVIEIKTRHIINKTLINSVKFCVTEPSLNKKQKSEKPYKQVILRLLFCYAFWRAAYSIKVGTIAIFLWNSTNLNRKVSDLLSRPVSAGCD